MFHQNYLRSLNRAIASQAGWALTEKEKRQPGERDVEDTPRKAKKTIQSEPLVRWWDPTGERNEPIE